MKVWIDLDGVIANFPPNAVRVAQELWPKRSIPSSYIPQDWQFSDLFTKEDWNAVWEKIKTIPDFWLRQEPYESNVSALRTWLAESDIAVYYITSRIETGSVPAYQQTAQWLYRHGLYPPNTRLYVVSSPAEKNQIIEDRRIDFGIDDLPSTVVAANVLPWHHCYLLSRPWNRETTNQTRVSSLQEFLDIVDAARQHPVGA